eukprot:COSAG06_NODE_6547_length_2887_cov_1.411406_1_plen_165_part_00
MSRTPAYHKRPWKPEGTRSWPTPWASSRRERARRGIVRPGMSVAGRRGKARALHSVIRILHLPLPAGSIADLRLNGAKAFSLSDVCTVTTVHGRATAAPAAVGILTYRRGSFGSELPGVRDGVCKLAAAAPLVALPNRAQKGDKEEDLLQSLALFFFAREGSRR